MDRSLRPLGLVALLAAPAFAGCVGSTGPSDFGGSGPDFDGLGFFGPEVLLLLFLLFGLVLLGVGLVAALALGLHRADAGIIAAAAAGLVGVGAVLLFLGIGFPSLGLAAFGGAYLLAGLLGWAAVSKAPPPAAQVVSVEALTEGPRSRSGRRP